MQLKIKSILVFIFMVVLGIFVLAGVLLRYYFWTGADTVRSHTVDIPAHSSTWVIGRTLQAAGVVRNAMIFRYFVTLTGQARQLKAGEYDFPAGVGLPEVIAQLVAGQTVHHDFLVPEGYTARQIADKLAAEGFARAQAFMDIVHDVHYAREWNVPAESLEGFLFPDTYAISKGMTAEQIVHLMIKRFQARTGEVLARQKLLKPLALVTLASIIEREVKAPQERARVASVFYNRIAKHMRLESCATVLYGMGRIGGSLSLADLQKKTPYNTYRHAGLPPGPIANPGLSALQAAAQPDQTDYLFFVVAGDGTHIFSKDFEAHKKAKWLHKRTTHP